MLCGRWQIHDTVRPATAVRDETLSMWFHSVSPRPIITLSLFLLHFSWLPPLCHLGGKKMDPALWFQKVYFFFSGDFFRRDKTSRGRINGLKSVSQCVLEVLFLGGGSLLKVEELSHAIFRSYVRISCTTDCPSSPLMDTELAWLRRGIPVTVFWWNVCVKT